MTDKWPPCFGLVATVIVVVGGEWREEVAWCCRWRWRCGRLAAPAAATATVKEPSALHHSPGCSTHGSGAGHATCARPFTSPVVWCGATRHALVRKYCPRSDATLHLNQLKGEIPLSVAAMWCGRVGGCGRGRGSVPEGEARVPLAWKRWSRRPSLSPTTRNKEC